MITLREKLVLSAAVAAVYGAALACGFHFDDHSIFTGLPLRWWQQTRPLTWLSFRLDLALWGGNAAGFHAVSLLLHAACVLLLFDRLALRMPRRAALVAAAVFALHPLQVEPVVYIFARGTLLAALFCLLAWSLWDRGLRWTAVPVFALALLAKEEAAAFPLLLLLLDRAVAPASAMLGLSLAAGLRVLAAASATPGSGAGAEAGISPLAYLSAQGFVILRYLRMAVLPWGFTVDPDVRVPGPATAILAWAAVGAVAWLAWRRRNVWVLGGLVLLLPSSSIFPAADLAADRRMYLPLACLAAAAASTRLAGRRSVAVLVAACLAVLAAARVRVWRSEESLWADAIRKAPAKLRPKLRLARALPPARALAVLAEARSISPNDARVASETGRVYMELGRPDRALPEFGRALGSAPRDPWALNNRGAALLMLGQKEAARADFEHALRIDPCLSAAADNLLRAGGRPPGCPP